MVGKESVDFPQLDCLFRGRMGATGERGETRGAAMLVLFPVFMPPNGFMGDVGLSAFAFVLFRFVGSLDEVETTDPPEPEPEPEPCDGDAIFAGGCSSGVPLA